jgi:hypothetical protein
MTNFDLSVGVFFGGGINILSENIFNKCFFYMQDYSVLYNNGYVSGFTFYSIEGSICDRIISLRGEIWAFIYMLTPPLFIEMRVPSRGS